ncbi:hypothetical protein LCGC14_2576030 [marine sediment metagenome]|uniref:Uncharacterized protein n=1 Tax=marine sediment metagenome TaxID=412755 RepID=A0A0F9AG90_9ZZZZ
MPDRNKVLRQTSLYWVHANVPGLDIGSAIVGLRYGMIIALRQSNYARAYTEATPRPEADSFEEEAVKEFMAAVPMVAGGNGHAT